MILAASQSTPLQRAQAAQTKRANDATLKLTASMLADNQWANGAGWTGPLPKQDTNKTKPADVQNVITEIERVFVSRNYPANVVTRHVDGIAGQQPQLGLVTLNPKPDGTATKAEQDRLNAMLADFRDWWDNSGAWLAVRQAVFNAVWSGKGTVRLFVPRSKLQEIGRRDDQTVMGIPAVLDLPGALKFLSCHAPAWDQAGLVRDIDGRIQAAYYRYLDENEKERWELQERRDGQTVVYPQATGNPEVDASDTFPVSDLLIFEVSLDPLIKDSIRRLAMFASKTFTMGSRNIDLGGFVETTILNAQMPPDGLAGGAGTTKSLVGVAVFERDPETQELRPTGSFANPSIVYKDPVPWTTFGDTLENVREAIFEEAKQLHVLISGDASASGVSRQQAVNDFLMSLEPTKAALEQLTRWLMTTVLRFGLHFSNRLAEMDGWKATAAAKVNPVPPTPDEVDTARALRKDGLISLKETHARIGIQDSAAMLEQMRSEGITPDIALVIIASSLPAFVGMKAAQSAWPGLGIEDADIAAQREIDLAAPQSPVNPADLTGDARDEAKL